MRRDHTMGMLSALVAVVVFTACGSDDTSGPAATEPAEASDGEAAAQASSQASSPSDTPSAATDGAACPDATALAAAYGGEVELDTSAATTGAVGLVFCPYNQVLAPGATDPVWGYEAIPDTFSITYTDQNVLSAADGEAVDVAGAEAVWSAGSELSVWTGERGLIVTLMTPPGDPLTTAIALAEAALA